LRTSARHGANVSADHGTQASRDNRTRGGTDHGSSNRRPNDRTGGRQTDHGSCCARANFRSDSAAGWHVAGGVDCQQSG
jgi:hypothetical protein